MVSPKQLIARGVPVYRLVHEEKSFVVTFPNAFHSGFNTGFNCAEAVNFGPPDWLPYGTDRAQKYRKDWKPLTLSHDALLVTLATSAGAAAAAARALGEDLPSVGLPPHSVAAEAIPPELEEAARAAEAAASASALLPSVAAGQLREVEQGSSYLPSCTASQPKDSMQGSDTSDTHGAATELPAGRHSSEQALQGDFVNPHSASAATIAVSVGATAAASKCTARRPRLKSPSVPASAGPATEAVKYPHGVVGSATLVGGHLGALDPVHIQDAPPEGIRLAAGELTLRAAEERRRIAVGSAAGPLPIQMMSGTPGAKDSRGCHTDTTDVDCELCKTDLWLSAVVSVSAPGRAVCPEHASVLPGLPNNRVLLCRYTPRDLEVMVEDAVAHVGGAREAVSFAKKRHMLWEARRPKVRKIGPMAKPHMTPLGEEVLAADAFVAGGPMPPANRPSLQVLDGTCCDDVEVESEAEDIPEVLIDSGAVPEHDAADYEPDLDGEDVSEDEDERPGRTGRSAQGSGKKDRKRRNADVPLRTKRKYVRRKALPVRQAGSQAGSITPSAAPSRPPPASDGGISGEACRVVVSPTQVAGSYQPSLAAVSASVLQPAAQLSSPSEATAGKLAKKQPRRRPDPAAAEAGALCPVGARRIHKPCTKLAGVDFEVELPLLKKHKQEAKPDSSAAASVAAAPQSMAVLGAHHPAVAPHPELSLSNSGQPASNFHALPRGSNATVPIMLPAPTSAVRLAVQARNMPSCLQRDGQLPAAPASFLQVSSVSAAVRDALAHQAATSSVAVQGAPSLLTWSTIGNMNAPSAAVSPQQPISQGLPVARAASAVGPKQPVPYQPLPHHSLLSPAAPLSRQPPSPLYDAGSHQPPAILNLPSDTRATAGCEDESVRHSLAAAPPSQLLQHHYQEQPQQIRQQHPQEEALLAQGRSLGTDASCHVPVEDRKGSDDPLPMDASLQWTMGGSGVADDCGVDAS